MQRSRRRRSRTRALVAALATTLAVTVLTPGAGPAAHAGPAAAEPNSPPVTVDDRLHMGVGWTYLASPLLNDTDPDGDKLDLCRLGRIPRNLEVRRSGNGLVIEARHQAANRTFSFTYYACDFEALVPGTITITIHERPGVRVTKVARPGVLRVHNPGRRTISFVYGGLGSNDPDGLLRVPRHASRTVRVHRHQLGWIAVNPQGPPDRPWHRAQDPAAPRRPAHGPGRAARATDPRVVALGQPLRLGAGPPGIGASGS